MRVICRGPEKQIEMENELLDFSDREDEYLSSEIKQQALSFAIITAVVGFAFSSWLFLSRKVGPASIILDRTAAEGTVVTTRSLPRSERGEGSGVFVPPPIRKAREEQLSRPRPVWKDAKAQIALASSSEKKNSKKVLETSLGEVPEYSRRIQKPRRRKTIAKVKVERRVGHDPERLLFPVIDERPDKIPLASVANKVAGNIVVLGNGLGDYFQAVVLDTEGHALISSALASPQYLRRVWVGGVLRKAELLATDEEFGIAYIKVQGGKFSNLPLAPVPPTAGESLQGFVTRGRNAVGQDLIAGSAFGRAGFFVDGALGLKGTGSALFNERAELVGLQVSSLPGAPGAGIQLAVDSSALYRLVRGYDGSTSGFEQTEGDALTALFSLLGDNGAEQIRRGRILPGKGVSIFYLGMEESEAKRWASAPEISSPAPGYSRWDCPAPPVSLYFARGRLLSVATDNTGFSTKDGLAVGARIDYSDFRDAQAVTSADKVILGGLEVHVGRDGKVSMFVVKPEFTK